MDYAKYTGSWTYKQLIGEALVLNSYDEAHDFFGTDHEYVSIVVGRWNDDVEWYAQAVVAGAELYGPDSYMPGLWGNGTWITLAQRTIDEVYDYWTPECGGGIYWSTDPAQSATYKSGITQLEFISLAMRTYLQTKNATLLHITEKLLTWIVDSGMMDLATGTVYDGVDTAGCTVFKAQWSYSYGHLVGGLSYLYQATGNSSYLSYAAKIAQTGIAKFAPTGVAKELCEARGTCNQDQQGFKAIFLRQLAYLHSTTPDKAMKSSISTVLQRSAKAALATCDTDWNCAGNWTNGSTQGYPPFRSTHLVAAALVALEGITK
ncbi:hydrolase 76 protein [Cadophora gregata]|uniref:hydrolase 76 protein n=1 Tax=Cadophora gregata TaxID=51156 RepID=UPI0026DBE461|nr:hydrolase 76 protein [Cadophora gregata]KAK0101427.1 hydrolase 76 protein [Cadophora gregata]KAK0106562.1 hydrolase 76 protein [Cadophora gregata f. sp. sojae]